MKIEINRKIIGDEQDLICLLDEAHGEHCARKVLKMIKKENLKTAELIFPSYVVNCSDAFVRMFIHTLSQEVAFIKNIEVQAHEHIKKQFRVALTLC